MRPLTPFVSYVDNFGHLLIGRVRFCNTDGSPAEVFSAAGATLGTSVLTDSSGRLSVQPYLADHDYVLYFDRYVGNAEMAEDIEDESWEEQGSAVERYNTVSVVTDGKTVTPVATVDMLRMTEPGDVSEFNGVKIVSLLGYNEAGDKPAVEYVWDTLSTESDNGGSVIKVDDIDTGRWVLSECPSILDVRHFGAFPSDSDSENTQQRYAVQNAGIYAHANGHGIFFHADEMAVFYDITGLTLYDVDSNPLACLYSVGIQSRIVGIENVHLGGSGSGHVELVATTVRTSWGDGYLRALFSPTEKLIFDSVRYGVPTTWSNIAVEMPVYPGPNITLDNCDLKARKVISGNITLRNMPVKTEWFVDGYDWTDLTLVDCTVRLDDCDSASSYVQLKNKMGQRDYGDLGEQTVSGKTLLPGCIAENAFFDNVTIQGSVELHNVSGTVSVFDDGELELNAVDCWLTFTNQSSFTVKNFSLRRGAITSSVKMTLTDPLMAVDSSVRMNLADAEVDCEMEVRYGSLHIERCVMNKTVSHIGLTYMREIVIGSTFNAQLLISAYGGNCKMFAVWKDNIGNVPTPISIDRPKFKPADADHSYVYEGNTGTFVPGDSVSSVETLSLVEYSYDSLGPVYWPEELLEDNCIGVSNGSISFYDRVVDGYPEYTVDHGIGGTKAFFRVGTDNFDVFVRWKPVSNSGVGADGSIFNFLTVPYEFMMVAKYVTGSDGLYKIDVIHGYPRSRGVEPPLPPKAVVPYAIRIGNYDGIGDPSTPRTVYASMTFSKKP